MWYHFKAHIRKTGTLSFIKELNSGLNYLDNCIGKLYQNYIIFTVC